MRHLCVQYIAAGPSSLSISLPPLPWSLHWTTYRSALTHTSTEKGTMYAGSCSNAFLLGVVWVWSHVQLVAADCLSEPLMEGGTTTTCPDLAPSPSACLRMLNSSPLNLFYSDPATLLHELSILLQNLSQVYTIAAGYVHEYSRTTESEYINFRQFLYVCLLWEVVLCCFVFLLCCVALPCLSKHLMDN